MTRIKAAAAYKRVDLESAVRHPGVNLVDDAGTCHAVVAVLRRLDEAAERRPLVAIGMPDRAEHVDGS